MRIFLIIGVTILFISPLMAALPEKIESLIRIKQYEQAIPLLESLAAQENNEAQNKLGEIYHFGPPGIMDYNKARELYLKAVSGGNGEAANHLGRIYMNGEGVKQDVTKAEYWYKKGMELGDVGAERNYYFSKKNPFYYVLDKTFEGDSEACLIAAQLYQSGGIGIESDEKKANEFRKKAEQFAKEHN